jgi:RNase P protein component
MYTYGRDDEIVRMIEEIEQEFDVVLTISKDIGEMTVSEFINEVQQVVTS